MKISTGRSTQKEGERLDRVPRIRSTEISTWGSVARFGNFVLQNDTLGATVWSHRSPQQQAI